MPTNDSITPSASITVGEATFLVNQVAMEWRVNSFPSISAGLQVAGNNIDLANNAGVEISLPRFANLTAVLQQRIVNEYGTAPDLKLSLNDGHSDTPLDFVGFSAKPAVGSGGQHFQFRLDGVHPMIALTAINPMIYRQQADYYAVDKVPESDSLAEAVKLLYSHLLDAYPKDSTSDDSSLQPVHRLNEKLRTYWDQLLDESKLSTTYPDLSSDTLDRTNLYRHLQDVITLSPDLWGAVTQILQTFRLQILMTPDGKGRIEHLRTVENPDTREIMVPSKDIEIQFTGLFKVPLVQSIVVGPGSPFYAFAGSNGADIDKIVTKLNPASGPVQNSATAIGRYPQTVAEDAVGRYSIQQAPPWMPKTMMTFADFQGADGGDPMDLNAVLAASKETMDILNRRHLRRLSFLDYLAELDFRMNYLAETQAVMTVPMNIKPVPGRTYKVRALSGQELFTGYLHTINHNLVVSSEGSSGDATTTLQFSHVVAPEAILKGLEPEDNTAIVTVGEVEVTETIQ